MSLEELHKFNGKLDSKNYVAVKGIVFDVSSSGNCWIKLIESYKPDASYGVFAGQDASIALGKMELSGTGLNEYGKTSQSAEEIQIMNDWVSYFQQRYPIVAKIGDKKTEWFFRLKTHKYLYNFLCWSSSALEFRGICYSEQALFCTYFFFFFFFQDWFFNSHNHFRYNTSS